MPSIDIRTMQEADVPEATRIFRLAFGTFLGLPDSQQFAAGRDYISSRLRSAPEAAFVATIDEQVVGSNFATVWGTFGFFGPLTVRPDLWNQGVAKALLAPTMEYLASRGVKDAGLFTFPNSAKHIGLYQSFGFWPRYLTALMFKAPMQSDISLSKFSASTLAEQQTILNACRALTNGIYTGLDVSSEIEAVNNQQLGDTVFLKNGDSLAAFAVCHTGENTEAGRDTCYVKFAAVQPQTNASELFERLLDACESFAAERGLTRLEAGVNLSRSQAYRQMLQRGFRAQTYGVAMHRPDSPAYNGPAVFVLDDWR